MKIRWFGRVSEEGLRGRTGQRLIVEELMRSRWRWYGYVLRMPDQRIPKQAVHWRPAGWRKVERPKDTCRRTLGREVREKDLNLKDLEARA